MSTNTRPTAEPTHNGVLEVSDLPAARVQRYAREADNAYRDLHLWVEVRAGR